MAIRQASALANVVTLRVRAGDFETAIAPISAATPLAERSLH